MGWEIGARGERVVGVAGCLGELVADVWSVGGESSAYEHRGACFSTTKSAKDAKWSDSPGGAGLVPEGGVQTASIGWEGN